MKPRKRKTKIKGDPSESRTLYVPFTSRTPYHLATASLQRQVKVQFIQFYFYNSVDKNTDLFVL